MGLCASCLGSRKKDVVDEDEEAPLFLEYGNTMHYASFNDSQVTGQDDPIETQRETEALQRVAARTSDNMIDIFEITPQENALPAVPAQYTYAGQDARMARYQHILSKLSDGDETAAHASMDWLAGDEDDTMEMLKNEMKTETGSEVAVALVGTFADAAAA